MTLFPNLIRADDPARAKPSAGTDNLVNFNRDIRPLLSENCFTCHGPDAAKRQAGLRLDDRAAALAPSDSTKPAIVPGDASKSELVARIHSTDDTLRMPPPDSGKQLTAEQIQLLTRWVEQDAPYAGHWSFTPPVRASVPDDHVSTKGAAPSNNPIDRFIRARLASEQLEPAPPADKVTQLRRVTLDLTGLPPTPAEVDRFLADESPEAYEKVVDRLLASPRYGERMAITWLDYARYADSNGYQSDGSRDIWAWREWVINAYNRNLPFDQFTIEQLAGDMLPNATPEQIVATGFNRNHRLNGEGGRIEAEWFVETVIDRVETTGLTWLGLTLNCCRCHDHKYDPISQKEFYSLFAFFNSVEESGVLAPVGKNGENTPPLMTIASAEQKAEQARLDKAVAEREVRWAKVEKEASRWLADWEAQFASAEKQSTNQWTPLQPQSVVSKGGATFTKQDDGSYLASGANPANDRYTVKAPLAARQFSGLMLEVLPDASLPNQSLGRGSNGNFVLTDISVRLLRPGKGRPVPVKFVRAVADYEQSGYGASAILANKPKRNTANNRLGWAVDGNAADKRIARRLLLAADAVMEIDEGSEIEVVLAHSSQFGDHNVGRFRLSVASAPPPGLTLTDDGIPGDVRSILKTPQDQRGQPQIARLVEFVRSSVPGPAADAYGKLEAAKKALKDFRDDLPTTMVMREAKPREAFVLLRGQYDAPGDKVERGLPSVLPPLPKEASLDRLGLARWIVDPSHPLTARVWVNREWERFFGLGLVRTTENLGSQAEYPSHPELLDWLACEFMEPTLPSSGQTQRWDMKALQKLMVMSQTYRQASRATTELLERDPENRLLARGPRFRLTGELIRD
ncbi:MAG: DUF1549 domain-containing protein [Pirellulaceae bacterium]|nr:DUF1549 domain-containing protein [Pirellulaceae bacterium]